MKKIFIACLILFLPFHLARSQTYTLTVINGYGSGTYMEGDTVQIWARSSYQDSVFTGWEGEGVDYLSGANEWHSTLTIAPGSHVGNIRIQAGFDTYPASTQSGWKSYKLYGLDSAGIRKVSKESFFSVPPGAKGIVFLLHGSDGSGKSFTKKYERLNIVKDLVYAGYAIFTLDANETTMGDQNGDKSLKWLTEDPGNANENNNIDIKNIRLLRDSVINDFHFSPDIPCFSFGMSNGSNFSDLCASALGFHASAHMTAKGKPDIYTRPDVVPVIWIMSENDHNENANNSFAFLNYQNLALRQRTEWHVLKRSPAYPQRFLRSLNHITPAQSAAVFQRLKDYNLLDSKNYLTELDISALPADFFDNLGLNKSQIFDVKQELLVINADHVMHSDFNHTIIRFFDQTLDPMSVAEMEDPGQDISLYPNPFHSSTHIYFDNPNQSPYIFKLFDLSGTVVISISGIRANNLKINRGTLENGMYIYSLSNGDKVRCGKVILE